MSTCLADRTAEAPTFVDLLRWRALHQPTQRAYTFLLDGETKEVDLTYGELDRQARTIAALLQSVEATGERALLLYPPGLDYIAAFLGCLYAEVVAVPAYPPNPARLAGTLGRLRAVANDARPVVALTTSSILSMAESLATEDPAFQAMRWLATDGIAADLAESWCAPAVNKTTLALLQYTSGSTAAPKGVMLTHGNLLHNSAHIYRCFAHTPASRGVIWLPPYHDMGLIGGVLQPLYGGFPVALMSPLDFLQRPIRWLQAISRYQATTSGGPNFAYDLCVRKSTPEQRATVDLSSWYVAFNGAEPIRHETLERFAAAFAPYGFRREAFYPCYGLAEATLIATGGQAATLPVVRAFQGAALGDNRAVEVAADDNTKDVRILVGCSQGLFDQQTIVVDPDSLTRRLPGQVGEIWLSGPSVAQGYWDRSAETERTFHALLADTRAGPFLRTGDLGFIQDGDLFVTGRLKDLIIIRGRNHYPQDIELTVEQSHQVLRPGCGVALSVDIDGDERLVVVQEVERQHRDVDIEEVAGAIRRAVAGQHELHVYALVLIKPGSIPKTSSGKIQRFVCRAAFMANGLEIVGSNYLDETMRTWNAANLPSLSRDDLLARAPAARQQMLETYLQMLVSGMLRVDPARVGPQRPLSGLGLDSLMAVELQHRIEVDLGVVVPMVHFLQHSSVVQLATQVLDQLPGEASIRSMLLVPVDQAERELQLSTLRPISRGGRLPLSFAQQRLWFLDQLAPGNSTYTIPVAVCLVGSLNIAALHRSLNEILRRHDVLRATFGAVDGQPVQITAPAGTFSLPVVDLRELPATTRAVAEQRLATQEAQRPFDLARGPLVRATVLHTAPQEHKLFLSIHHIVSDGWSMKIFLRELAALYESFSAGRPSPLPELPVQYVDFAVWQRQWLQGAVREAQVAYWRQQLSGKLAALDLPTERSRAAVQTFRGARQSLALPEPLSEALRVLSRREEVTLFMTLLAVFQMLLSRYSGQNDIIVGTPIAGRTRAKTEGLIGFFVNTLVLRADLSGNPSFRELLHRVRGVCLDGYAHQDLPFEQVVEALQPTRDLSRAPLFQVFFNMLSVPDSRIGLPELTLEISTPPEIGAKFDITLYAKEQDTRIQLELVYNADLFGCARMIELLEQLKHLLSGVVENPEERLARFSLVTPTARARLPNPAEALDSRWEGAVHTRFFQQARRVPERPAVVDSQEVWSYRELDSCSSQLANYLHTHGLQSEEIIAIYGQRSAALVWALLGVLKAGAAFVILDPAYPASRLIACLRATRPRGWLQVEAAGALPHALEAFVATESWRCRLELPQCRATARDLLPDYSIVAPQVAVGPDDLAYVGFTSGSMGRPKGILGTHRSLSHFLHWYTLTFRLGESDRFSMLSGLSHDPLLRDIFTPLWLGATLCIPDPIHLGAPDRLLAWMEGITVAHLTPTMGRLLTEIAPSSAGVVAERALTSLRHVFFGGDVLTRQDVSRLRTIAPAATCVNFYGATETPQAIGYFIVPTQEDAVHDNGSMEGLRKETIPVGRGITNVQLLVLNSATQLAGMSEIGEIYVRTPYLARGYLGDEVLTGERFIVNPFTNIPSDRLYRTGDLGRYSPDGTVDFCGRADQQIKIRGFRVELGEIEVVLGQHPSVRECAVVAREDTLGDKRLVAYIVQGSGVRGQGTTPLPPPAGGGTEGGAETRRPGDKEIEGPTQSSVLSPQSSVLSELRAFLTERLPDYMVPATFMVLGTLPLTPNGKVDRNALPTPDRVRPELSDAFTPPRTPSEQALVRIWTDVLRLERIGVHDNFFELGGHSLLATQIIARVRNAFQVELSLRSLFEAPTVARLAERIDLACRAVPGLQTPALRPVPRNGALPLSSAQQRLWFLDQLRPASPIYSIPITVRLVGLLELVAFQHSLNEIVRRHEALRTTFATVDGRSIQVIAPTLFLRLPMVDLSGCLEPARAAAARRLITAEARRFFNLAHGPLLRAALLRLSQQEHVLLLSMHHTVCDVWSLGVFIAEQAALYAAYSASAPSPLPDLPIQYADYAVWQRQQLQGQALQAQLAYWEEQLAGLPTLNLPTDYPRPAVQTYRGAKHTLLLPRSLTEALTALSRQEEATLFMVLLAAFQTLLYRYTAQHDIAVGTPIAGRTQAETEGLIGYFANTLVLRTVLSGNPTFQEALGQVRAVALGAYAHQEVPFEQVVEALRPARDLSHNPLFQVLFGFHNMQLPPLSLPGLTLSLLDVDSLTARFDLALDLWEGPEGLRGSFEYNTDLFAPAKITRMIGHYQVLLEGIVANPYARLSDLPILTNAEQQQLVSAWNDTRAPYSENQVIHHLFEAHAARTPDAVALVFDDRPPTTDQRRAVHPFTPSPFHPFTGQQLTYHELNARANQLAHHLRALRVGPEVPVGIYMERSLNLLIAILGVLKAGGAYVPLDPAYPAERLAFMLTDAQAPVLLTQSHLRARLPHLTTDDRPTLRRGSGQATNDPVHPVTLSPPHLVTPSPHVVCLETDWAIIACQSAANPIGRATAENLAYVIYTSGSTGKSKGVQVNHRSVINLLETMDPVFHFGTDDVWTMVHSYAFDFSVWEIWGPLLHGGCLVVVPLEVTRVPTAFYALLSNGSVTVLNQTPSAIRQLIDARQACADSVPAPALRLIICGGEDFPGELVPPLLAWDVPLWNFYGPTEATVWAAAYKVVSRDSLVPVGRPIANTQIYLLDVHLRLVPIGVPGELYISGVGLSRGYLNRPELTAERFTPNPFWGMGDGGWGMEDASPSPIPHPPSPGTRLYKTGDLARYREDGMIEFLGRIDHQVKVRGFRIELGEIETVLSQHPAVAEAVVVLWGSEQVTGEKRLVAYVVPKIEDRGLKIEDSGSDAPDPLSSILDPRSSVLSPQSSVLSPQSSVLRAFLKEKLPDYMHPSAFVLLEALPLSSNGKVDRRALPAPEGIRPELETAYVAPRPGMERAIATIWQEVLQVAKVGVHDNFFDLGGSSVQLVRVHSKLQHIFDRDIPLIEMFKNPTTGALTKYLSSDQLETSSFQQRDYRDDQLREGKNRLKRLLKGAKK